LTADSRERRAAWTWLALAVACLPLLPLARRLPRELATDYSVGDLASTEIAVFDTIHGGRLIGHPTRFAFHQLGPSHFYLQAPLYAASGERRFALSLTALLVNWGAFLFLLFALGRWSGSAGAALVLPFVAVGFLGYLESATLFNYWGQYLIVLPFAALLAAAAAVADNRPAAWPALLALASFAVHGYGSTIPAAAAVVGGAALLQWWRRRRSADGVEHRPRTAPRRAVLVALSLAVLALFWGPVVLDELQHDPGNLSRMLGHFRAATTAPPPPGAAAAAIAPHLAGPWWRLAHGASLNTVPDATRRRSALGLAAALVAALVVTAAAAGRAGRAWSAALCPLLLLAIGAALVSSRKADGPIFPYVYFWLAAAAALGWVVVLGFWLDRALLLGRAGAWLAARGPLLHLGAASVLAAALLLRPLAVPRLGDASVAAFDRSLDDYRRNPRLAERPVHLVSHDFAWPWSLSLLLELAKRGVPVSIANVQGDHPVPELQGLLPRWLNRRPGSVDVHLFDRDPGPQPGLRHLLCHPVLPLDATKPVVCMYGSG
jgi:hypothetical protein